jgi:acetyl esterase/lipase
MFLLVRLPTYDIMRSQYVNSKVSMVVCLSLAAGDSAGANLTVSLLNHLQNTPSLASLRSPLASCLYSPWIDLGARHADSPLINSDGSQVHIYDFFNGPLSRFWGRNFSGELPLTDPRISPLFLESSEIVIPKGGSLVIYGGAEMLVGSIREFVGKMKNSKDAEAASRIEVFEWPGMPHSFK